MRRQASAPQGTGPSSAQSTLQVPAPGLKRAHGRPARRESCVPASATNARGEVSSSTARAGGSSASDVTGLSVCTTPPRRRSSLARPWVMAALASRHDGPAGPVAERGEEEAEGGGQRGRERLHRVRRRAGQQGACRIGGEAARRVLHRRASRRTRNGRAPAGHAARCASAPGRRPRCGRASPPAAPPGPRRPRRPRRGGMPSRRRRGTARRPAPRRADGRRPPRAGAARPRGRPGRASGRRVRPPAPDAPPSTRRDGSPRGSAPGSGSRPRSSAPPRRPPPRDRPGPASARRPGRWVPSRPRRRLHAARSDVTERRPGGSRRHPMRGALARRPPGQ